MPSPQCHFCGAPLVIGDVVPRDLECEACRRDVRCCINCRHYDTRFNNACRETMADPVADKDRRNFCEYFAFNPEPFEKSAGSARQGEARAKLDALFGGAKSATPDEGARKKLDAMFESHAKRDRAGDAKKKLEGLFGKTPEPEAKSGDSDP